MATLPTLTVTDAQQQRIIAAFTDPTGVLTPQQMYKKWLKESIIDKVKLYEAAVFDEENMPLREAKMRSVQDDLNTAT